MSDGRISEGRMSNGRISEGRATERPTDVESLVAVAAASRAGLGAADAWRAWDVDVHLDDDGAPAWSRDDALAGEARAAARLAHSSGIPLADVLDALARVERARIAAARGREAAIAGARASARVLAWLPAVGMGLGVLVEPRTATVLFGTPFGWALLGVSGLLVWLGRWWMRALIRGAVAAGHVP
jgi:tight adherence protein B